MGNIVWLASYPKSGNTWLRAFLINLLTDSQEPIDINKMAALTFGDSQSTWYEKVSINPPHSLSSEELADLRPKVHKIIAESSGNSVFVKTHNALVEVSGANMITHSVTAGVIYIVRNPLDVTLSYSDHLGQPLDNIIDLMSRKGFETPASEHHVPEHYSDWSTHVNSWTKIQHPALHIVRYEDMATQPLNTFSAITKFLGMKVQKSRLQRAIRFSSFKELAAQEKASGFIERTPVQKQFFRSGKSGAWKNKLSKNQVKRIIAIHAGQMVRFDYLPKGY